MCGFTSELQSNIYRHELECGRKKRHYPATGVKRGETVKSKYDKQQSGLQGGPSDVFCRIDYSPSLVVEKATIIRNDDEDLSESVPSFLTKFADILQQMLKEGEQRTALQQFRLLTDASFDLNFCRVVQRKHCRLQLCS